MNEVSRLRGESMSVPSRFHTGDEPDAFLQLSRRRGRVIDVANGTLGIVHMASRGGLSGGATDKGNELM